jgi:hypothetical protein
MTRINRRQFPSLLLVFLLFTFPAFAASAPVHGLWVWKSSTVLAAPHAAAKLRDFCKAQDINEVYVSVSAKDGTSEDGHFTELIAHLHHANIRVEALLSNTDADEAGKPREKLLDLVRAIVQFTRRHPENRFDGIHLDIEPQQRPENKGAGNLKFLPGLVDAWRRVRALAEPAQLTVNADIQNKLLKGSLAQRKMLLSALPRLTLMLYELSNPSDGSSTTAQADKLRQAGENYFNMAYQGLGATHLARMAIGLRTPDYQSQLPNMLKAVQQYLSSNPHYLGWAWHSYNDAN